jgi:hypothetical protein
MAVVQNWSDFGVQLASTDSLEDIGKRYLPVSVGGVGKVSPINKVIMSLESCGEEYEDGTLYNVDFATLGWGRVELPIDLVLFLKRTYQKCFLEFAGQVSPSDPEYCLLPWVRKNDWIIVEFLTMLRGSKVYENMSPSDINRNMSAEYYSYVKKTPSRNFYLDHLLFNNKIVRLMLGSLKESPVYEQEQLGAGSLYTLIKYPDGTVILSLEPNLEEISFTNFSHVISASIETKNKYDGNVDKFHYLLDDFITSGDGVTQMVDAYHKYEERYHRLIEFPTVESVMEFFEECRVMKNRVRLG